jgi:hypothetical protein
MSDESYKPGPSGKPPVSTRAIARQGTSSVAFRGEEPDPDDPLLSFEPVPHVAPRRNSITAERQRAFIAHLAATGIVKQAARHIGASLEALYKLRHKHGGEEFSAAWDLALDRGVARLEDCALARAIEGEERMVVSAGKVLGTEVRHNEALVTFFLRGRRVNRYQKTDIGPGHPVYEKVKAAYEEEQRKIRSDPAQLARIHKSIEVKMTTWRQDLERDWEARRLRMIEENGGEVPRIDNYASWRRERAHRDPVFDDPAMDEEWYERARRGELGRMGPDEPKDEDGEPGSGDSK